MRAGFLNSGLTAALMLLAAPAAAQPAGGSAPAAAPRPAVDRCADRSRVLGVSRIVEIDTTAGPRFGHQQYKDVDFLQDGEVVLTFDDGPLRPYTQPILDALDAHCTKGTFFIVGSQAIADPEMVRRIAQRGHTLANHTWSHANLRQMDPGRARYEVELGFSAISLAAGRPIAPFFRFPFLADSRAMKAHLETRNVGAFSIEVDALDYRNKEDPEAVHQEVLKQLAWHKKGIVLFHDIQPSSAAALPGLLAALKARNFKIVHIKPTQAVTTLPEFDAIARRQFDQKRIAAAGNPLANRTLTWSQPGRPPAAGGPPAQAPPTAPSVPWAAPAKAPATTEQPLPWATGAPPPPPPRASPRENDWMKGVFGRD
jgi:peptidoglycan/xylan/chitin deacetylase (PgdA/CDA1 family)